jgi:hypothetical protein
MGQDRPDDAFHRAARSTDPAVEAIAANNRLVSPRTVLAGRKRQPDRRAKLGFEVDLFGNVPCIATGSSRG